MCCHSLSKFLHKASKIFSEFCCHSFNYLYLFQRLWTEGSHRRFFSLSGGVDIKSNTFLFELPLYESVLHNSLSDCILDLIQVSLRFYVLLTQNCSMDLCKNRYFRFVLIFILLHFHARFHQSNENHVINVGSFSL